MAHAAECGRFLHQLEGALSSLRVRHPLRLVAALACLRSGRVHVLSLKELRVAGALRTVLLRHRRCVKKKKTAGGKKNKRSAEEELSVNHWTTIAKKGIFFKKPVRHSR
jgi:hypothetical protein